MLASFGVDYSLRQKATSAVKQFVVKQAPILPPSAVTADLPWADGRIAGFLVPRVVELSYTSWDLAVFAEDCCYGGAPFRWRPERRATLQAEIDALVCYLYGLERDDVDWMLDTFTVLRKYEEKAPNRGGHGEFRTKRLVLERFDAMAKAVESGAPYETPLAVPPADDSMRHTT